MQFLTSHEEQTHALTDSVVYQMMLTFSYVWKPIKSQRLAKKNKNGRNAIRTGAKIYFNEEKIRI